MPRQTLAQGECAHSIAAQHGTPWNTVWEHPENSGLRARRPGPAALQPGDVLFFPEREGAPRPCAVHQKNRFVAKGRTTLFRLRLLGEGGTSRAGQPYTLSVDGASPATCAATTARRTPGGSGHAWPGPGRTAAGATRKRTPGAWRRR